MSLILKKCYLFIWFIIISHAIISQTVTTTQTNVSCYSYSNGIATASVTGGSGSFIYSWSSVPTQTSQTAINLVAGTYSVTVSDTRCNPIGAELIPNGDFTAGNIGITSSYSYKTPPNIGDGEYYVGTDANPWNPGMSSAGDHTSGSGDFMMVNGSATANTNVYCQTVAVAANTDYSFSTWLSNLTIGAPASQLAQLQFYINGIPIGSVFTSPTAVNTWTQFFANWNSGVSTSANICIVNQSTSVGGNDFGLDDISFRRCALQAPITQTVSITQPPIVTLTIASTNSICLGQQTATLTVSGADSYTWSAGLSSATGSLVTGSPVTTTNYTVIGSDMGGCIGTQTTTINVNSIPVITANSASICLGQQTATITASGALSYTWVPALGLSTTSGSVTVANPTITTTYSVGAIDINGCVNYTTSIITIKTQPTVTAISSRSICAGQQTATLTASGAASYSWSPATALSSTTGVTTNVNPIANTIYSVTGTNSEGCFNTGTVSVNVIALPILTVNNESICLGQQTATLTVNGATSYTWVPNTSLSTTSGSVVVANPNTTQTYSVVGISTSGCYNYTTSTVFIRQLPTVTVTKDSICEGQQTATLTASGAFTYSWSPATTLSSFGGTTVTGTPIITTTYSVVGVDGFGCVDTTITEIFVHSIPTVAIVASTSTLCTGDDFLITPSGANSYTLVPGTNVTLTDFILTPTITTSYAVIGTSTAGCYSTNAATLSVTVYTLPIIFALSDATLNVGQSAPISANGGIMYNWEPSAGIICPTCATTKAKPDVTTEYIVFATDSFGCAGSDTILITVNYVCADFFIPNVFSPNGDGLNDGLNVHGACIATYRLQLFDRWGELVFETDNASNSWAGNYKGKQLDTGVFAYKVNGVTKDGTAFNLKGNVTLLR